MFFKIIFLTKYLRGRLSLVELRRTAVLLKLNSSQSFAELKEPDAATRGIR